MRLEGKVGLITGGGTGIGLGVARCFAREGARLALVGRRREVLEAAATELGGDVLCLPGDVRRPDDVQRTVAATLERFGRIDALVCAAGVAAAEPSEEVSLATWHHILDTNLTGSFLYAQACGQVMLRQGSGSILFIGSITSFQALPGRAAYGASKAALLQLARTLGVEWAARGVRTNIVVPGYIDTPLLREMERRGAVSLPMLERRVPMGFLGQPEDIGAMAAFLCSDEARYVTGQSFVVDGGWLAYGFV